MKNVSIICVLAAAVIAVGELFAAVSNDYLRGDTGAASSIYNDSYPPREAFDGNDSGDNANMWHSASSTGPHYLRSDDLGANVPFTFIRTVGRSSFANRIIGMSVGVFTNSAPTFADAGTAVWSAQITQVDQTFVLPAGSVTGRTVMVYGTPVEGWANIAEVIAGYEAPHNLAAGTSPSQSSTFGSYGAGYAVDENNSTFSHTAESAGNHWWKTDLGADLPVTMIRVDGRSTLARRLYGMSIMLYDSADASGVPVYSNIIDSVTDSSLTQYFPMPSGTTARSVLIYGNPPNDNYLNFCECRVFGGYSAAYPNEFMVKPLGVSGISYYAYNQHYDNVISGSGLYVKGYTHGNGSAAQGMWHAGAGFAQNGAGVTDDQELTFTLPGAYTLTDAYFWAHNQAGYTDRSIRRYDLSVSSDGVNFTQVVTDAETSQAGGTVDETYQTESFSAVNDVRFVRLGIDTAWNGSASTYVGLSEIRFGGTRTAAGPIIENSFASAGAGLSMPPVTNDVLKGKVPVSSIVQMQGGTLEQLTDGVGSSESSHRVVPADNSGLWTLTYNLGFRRDIDRINLYTYNTDNRRSADFDVEYSTDHGATYSYLFIGANNYPLGTGNVTLTSISMEDDSPLMTGATNLRLTLRPVNNGTQHTALIEIDALGPPLPPGTLILIQ